MAGKYRDFDGQYAMIEVNFIIQDPRLDTMTSNQRWIYVVLWCYAVQQRSDTFRMPDVSKSLSRLSRVDARSIFSALTKLQQLCLIEYDGKNTITVCGIKNKHPNLKWKENSKSEDLDSKSVPKRKRNSKRNKEKEKEKENNIPYDLIVSDLNKKSNQNYRSTSSKNQELIRARWNEGYTLPDFEYVHTVKCEQWLNTESEQYLRPLTLWGTKFESYRNQRPLKQIQSEEKWARTAKCPKCANVGAVVEWPKDIPKAKEATGKDPIWQNGTVYMQCSKCEHKWNI